ncbi:hypothetical protein LWI28_029274 [Acer negundo]|uniref:BED-type domain-containing protein n=1 Tax=Acer negundo TaxID=4023 RepID=A0AAD5NI60_ACENE|nr:hypothetical protein LWI28_029274 [Acer negundo]
MSDIDTPSDYDFDPPETDEDEPDPKLSKSDQFVKHMKKVRQENGSYVATCNYCKKVYKWSKSGGYDTYRKHIQTKHPEAETRSSYKHKFSGTLLLTNNYFVILMNKIGKN